MDETDRISAAHSRHILAADAQLVALGSTQAVCISFEGQSFVLHQVPLPCLSDACFCLWRLSSWQLQQLLPRRLLCPHVCRPKP